MCLLSQLLSKVTHMLQFLLCSPSCGMTHSNPQRHWPITWSMKRSNSLPHSVMIACFSWLIVVNRRRWWTNCRRAPQTVQSTVFKSGLFGGHIWGSMNMTFPRRRYVAAFLAVCDGVPSCCRHPCKMPALILQDVTVTLDNNWDNKHVVPCC